MVVHIIVSQTGELPFPTRLNMQTRDRSQRRMYGKNTQLKNVDPLVAINCKFQRSTSSASVLAKVRFVL